MTVHLIQGEAGCAFAVTNKCVAVIVDALRASATAAMLLDAGATELCVVSEVSEAFDAKRAIPHVLLFGERGGLPPEGFDFGNSPRTVEAARGKPVVFTTTSGARRLVDSWGAHAIYMGSTVNARAVARTAAAHDTDIVLIPAGLSTDPTFSAQEDWVAASVIASASGLDIGEGALEYRRWQERIRIEGVPALFASAPHAAKLLAIRLEDDITYCAQIDITDVAPMAAGRFAHGVIMRAASRDNV